MRKAKGFLAVALSVSMVLPAGQAAFAATTSNEVSAREKENAALAREAGAECMVLLENNGALPVKAKRLALFGGGAVRTVRGGTGSGDPFNGGLSGGGDVAVNQSERYNINILNSFEKAGYQVTTSNLLKKYAEGYDKEYASTAVNPMATFVYPELTFTEEELAAAAAGTDTAIYVIARNAGEGADRNMTTEGKIKGENGEEITFTVGDYELTDLEKDNLRRVSAAFDKTIVVLNVGGVIDTKFFDEIEGLDSLLLMGQAGQEGGNALMDVIDGTVTPSGKLVATWAKDYKDNPAAGKFAKQDGDSLNEFYEEGIYVGYRYFDTFGITPQYEFGYGKSYTDFDIEVTDVTADAEHVTVKAMVTNTGTKYSGSEVVQVYFSAPDSEQAEKEYQQLAAYGKTDVLSPGECQAMTLTYDVAEMAYYNEEKAAYVLDPGTYYVRVGNSSRNTRVSAALQVNAEKVTEQLSNQMEVAENRELKEWSKAGKTPFTYPSEAEEKAAAKVIEIDSSAIVSEHNASPYEDETVTTYTTDRSYEPVQEYETVKYVDEKDVTLLDVYNGEATMQELVAQMSLEELARLNCGSGWGVANESNPIVGSNSATVPGAAGETVAYQKYKIPSIVSADGPGGIRVKQEYEATNVDTGEKSKYYQYATAWPVHYMLAQSWDTELVERIGRAFGVECAELNITTLLGPSLNIHRDPLCGRNFEYFGEDPAVAGTMASAVTKGVQSVAGIGACLKHYAANSQETDRSGTDSVVSERALREIYLKGFEIAIKESCPSSIMTSYNQINGVPTADSYDLCTNLARGEWGFNGLIMTDWNGGVSHPSLSMHAGNDLIMPGGSSKANEIVKGAEDVVPVFDERGQIGLKDEMMMMFAYKSAAWGDFAVSANGTQTVTAVLGEGHTAAVEGNQILVDQEPVYREYEAMWWAGTGTFKTPVTTDVASVGEDGKSIIYKGNYADNNDICLGDVQKSAINNLNIIMRSNDMARIYGTKNMPYTQEFAAGLKEYQTVAKSEKSLLSGILKDQLEETKKQVAELEALLGATQETVASLSTQLNDAKAEAAGFALELNTAKQEAAGLKAKLETAESNVSSLTTQLGEAKGTVAQLQTQLAETNGDVTGLRTQLSEAQGRVTNLETQLSEAQNGVIRLSEKLNQTEGTVSGLTTQLSEAQGKVTSLETQLKETKDQIPNFEKQLKEAQDTVKALAKELEDTKNQSNSANNAALDKMTELEKQLAGLTERLNAAKQNEESLRKEIEALKASSQQAKTTVKIKKNNYSVKVGKKVTVKVTVKNANGKKVTYKSANKKIATVTKKGVVKGIKKGRTTITVKCNGVSKKVKVTVQ